jgi:predicted helicase
MRHVYPLDCLIEHAISRPLGSWCLLLTFAATADEEADFSMMSFTIPWHRQANLDLETLRCDGFALIACERGPVEAFKLLGALRGRRVGVRVFDPEGRSLPVEVSTSPDAQKLFGVYPTPRPLARWVTRSVDALLRELMGERDGLATCGLRVLDPAAGPMNFILEAYRRAIAGWRAQNGRAGLARLVWEHLVPDFQGIEILADRWAAGHHAVRDYLQSVGLELAPEERVPLFLADALASSEAGTAAGFLGEQAARASRTKYEEPVKVILGNPPYNGRPAREGAWISDLLRDYFQVDGKPLEERNPKWLLDDYVKFLRLAQWVVERQGEGIVAFVVNHNCLEAPTFRGLRRSLLHTFDRIYALDLHGNVRKQVEGREDENVFEGVAQGVAVLLLVKRPGLERKVFRGDLHGTREEKLRALARSPVERLSWAEVQPRAPLWLFRPSDAQKDREFQKGLPLPEIFPLCSLGVVTGQDARVLALDRGELEARLQAEGSGSCRRFLSSFLARPFDLRHALYLETALERPRKAVMEHLLRGANLALLALRQSCSEEPSAFVTRWLVGHKVVSSYAPNTVFPLYLLRPDGGPAWPNLGGAVRRVLADRYGEMPPPEAILGYVYALLHSTAYRARYREQLRHEFPRIAFPAHAGELQRMAALGLELVSVHLLEDGRLLASQVRLEGDPGAPLTEDRRRLGTFDPSGGRVILNGEGLCFEGIDPEIWRYRIGSYRVLEHWLKARAGRVLSYADTRDFRRIAAAIGLSLELQARIDQS